MKRLMSRVPQIYFEEHRLGNGLQVLLSEYNQVPLVHVSLHYRVGSSYERPGFSGLAHLFEHMMFQGSENVGKTEHGRHVDEAGGSWNASTNKDRTNYFETLPSHYLDLALWLEADRMGSLRVTAENFDNQRKTVIEEKKQAYDNRPYGLSYLRFDQLAYQNWAYAHPIIGSVGDLEEVSLEDAQCFHRTYYGPGNATLVISGDIQASQALDKVRRWFGPIQDRTKPELPELREPVQRAEKREEMQDPLAVLPAVSLGYHMPQLGSPTYYALSILSIILTQGDSSRFYRKLVYDRNWITNLFAGPNQYKGPQLFAIWFQIQNQVKVDRVVQAVEDELERVQDQVVGEKEMEKAKNQITFHFVNRQATVSQIGESLAHYALYFEDPDRANHEIKRFLAVTKEDILTAAQRTLCSQNRTLIVVEPGAPESTSLQA